MIDPTSPLVPPDGSASYRWGERIEEVFAYQARRSPRSTAIRQGTRSLTYGEVFTIMERIAGWLIAHDVGPEAQVAIRLPRSPELICVFLGVLRAGATAVLLDSAWPEPRVLSTLDHKEMKMLVSASLGTLETAAHDLGITVVAPETLWQDGQRGDPSPGVIGGGDAVASIFYTSGSTGTPKGVLSPHRGVVRTVVGCPGIPLDSDSVFLQAAPLPWDACQLELWAPLLNGGTVILLGSEAVTLDAAEFAAAIQQGVNSLWMTSSLFTVLVEENLDLFATLRLVLVGGERVSIAAARRLLEAYPHIHLVNGYGPAEATIFATVFPIDHASIGANETDLPIGRAIPHTPLLLLNDAGQPISGTAGELAVGGDGVARGYAGNPEETSRRFFEHHGERFYRTGDLVEIDDTGRLRYRGRTDHQVKISGVRIEVGEVESALEQHPALSAACVVAVEHGGRTILGAAVIGTQVPPVAELLDYLNQRLLPVMVPHTVLTFHELPMTTNGKVNRRLVAQRVLDALGASCVEAAQDSQDMQGVDPVLREARDATGIPDLAMDTPLVGSATSLSLIRLAARLCNLLDAEVRVSDLYRGASLAGVLRHLDETGRLRAAEKVADRSLASVGDDCQGAPLTRAQLRFWLAEANDPGAVDNMVALCFAIEGLLDMQRFAQAIKLLVARHVALRTCYPWHEDGPVQWVLPGDDGPKLGCSDVAPEFSRDSWADVAAAVTREAWVTPFEMDSIPPVRFQLWRVDDDRHLLVIHAHHIAIDGWSEQVLIGELCEWYRTGAAQDESPDTVQLTIGATEAARVPNLVALELPYWSRVLHDAPGPFLPPPASSGEAQRLEVIMHVPAGTVSRLNDVCSFHAVPLSAALLTAVAASLGEQFRQGELVVGQVDPGREGATERAVGYFVNPYAVRVPTQASPSTMLLECADAALKGWQHAQTPFDELVVRLRPPRGRHPWFQVLSVLQGGYIHENLGPDTLLHEVRVVPPKMTTELTVEAFPTAGGSWECVVAWRADGLSAEDGKSLAFRISDSLEELSLLPADPAPTSSETIS